jgi:hypothetical protein
VVETAAQGARRAVLSLFRVNGAGSMAVHLETDGKGWVRLRVSQGMYVIPSEWYPLGDGTTMTVTLHADTAHDRFVLTSTTGYRTTLAANRWTSNWKVSLAVPRFALARLEDQLRAGVGLTAEFGPPLRLCNRVLDDAA